MSDAGAAPAGAGAPSDGAIYVTFERNETGTKVVATRGINGPRFTAMQFDHVLTHAEEVQVNSFIRDTARYIDSLRSAASPPGAARGEPHEDELAQRIVREVSGDDWAAMTDGQRNNYRNAVRAVASRPAGAAEPSDDADYGWIKRATVELFKYGNEDKFKAAVLEVFARRSAQPAGAAPGQGERAALRASLVNMVSGCLHDGAPLTHEECNAEAERIVAAYDAALRAAGPAPEPSGFAIRDAFAKASAKDRKMLADRRAAVSYEDGLTLQMGERVRFWEAAEKVALNAVSAGPAGAAEPSTDFDPEGRNDLLPGSRELLTLALVQYCHRTGWKNYSREEAIRWLADFEASVLRSAQPAGAAPADPPNAIVNPEYTARLAAGWSLERAAPAGAGERAHPSEGARSDA